MEITILFILSNKLASKIKYSEDKEKGAIL